MDVRLSPEQQALRDSAAQVVDRLGPRTVAALGDHERTDKLDAAIAASGWRELRVADDGDRPLASGVEAAIVAEELGRGLADAPFVGPTLAAEWRRLAGAPPAATTETVAVTSSLSGPLVLLDGRMPPGAVAIDAQGVASALLLVRTDDGDVVAQAGVGGDEVRTDLTRPTAGLEPSGALGALTPIEVRGVLGPDDRDRWTALGLALTCADLVGAMRGAIDLTVDYAGSRRQYGRPIGSFQAVQHLLADAFVLMEGSRSTARYAAWAVDALPVTEALAAAALAKAYCARSARMVCETAIQVHGGIGNTWECLAHVFLRRALFSSDLLGGAGPSLERVLAHHGLAGGDGLR